MFKLIKRSVRACISLVVFVPDLIYWHLCLTYGTKYKRSVEGGILLVPPANLDGSFGDELMVTSYIHNFARDQQVTIFTPRRIDRTDFLSKYPNVNYLGGLGKHNYGYMLKILPKFSKVVVIGADVLDGSYGTYESLKYLKLLRLANKLGIETSFMGFSVSKIMPKIIAHEFVKVSNFTKIKARDTDSYKRLLSFVPKDQLLLTSDMAFVCPDLFDPNEINLFDRYSSWCEDSVKSGRLILGLCPNAIQATKIGYALYLEGLRKLIDSFNLSRPVAVVFLYHDIRVFDGFTDKSISKELYSQYINTSIPVYFNNDIQNGIELKTYLRLVDLTVTGRMHFGISGIAVGKPMFGICYANKFEGMLRLFGIDPDSCLIDYTRLQDCEVVIKRFLSDLDDIVLKIENSLSKVKSQSLMNGDH